MKVNNDNIKKPEIKLTNIKPLLKWVGGKSQIIDDIFQKFPTEIDTYYEPFVGGGSVFLELIKNIYCGKINVNKIKINDLNKNLIYLYKSIKNEPNELLKKLKEYSDNYNTAENIKYEKRHKCEIDENDCIEDIIDKGKCYVYYYYRNYYNGLGNNINKSVEISALFLFLNKTGFRGLYREGPNGYNVPFGNYGKPTIYDKNQILDISKLLNYYNVEFYSSDFLDFCENINGEDFVYFDPPYYPLDKKSFTTYNKEGFSKKHDNLINLCDKLNEENIKFLQSNSSAEFNLNNYNKYKIDKIKCKRRINSKNPESTVDEILIYNF